MKTTLDGLYRALVLARPRLTLLLVLLFTAGLGWFAQELKIDISADSLVLENDDDLEYYRAISARYESEDSLIITYTPHAPLFQRDTLEDIRQLRDSLRAMPRVSSVVTLLDVPLVESPAVPLSELEEGIRTLEDPATDITLAARELRSSPLYRNRLVGEAGDTTALQINLKRDDTYIALRERRDTLREKELDSALTPEEAAALERASREFRDYSALVQAREEEDIATIRALMERYRNRAELHLGGVPMIVADMMSFVRHDIRVFGLLVLGVMALILVVAFRQLRWVALSLVTAVATTITTVGALGLAGWQVTVVSSNFLALLLIFVLSLTIHLIVRYRELQSDHPQADQAFLVGEMVRSKAEPCLYMVLTTMVAFGSLVVSGIRPVIDFGWMMGVSLTMALILNFTLFPALLMLMTPGNGGGSRKAGGFTNRVINLLPPLIERRAATLFASALAAVLLGGAGLSALTVENRFIDHFKNTTEIHQGMLLIDQRLGGTTPLDVIINAPRDAKVKPTAPAAGGEPGFLDELFDFGGEDAEAVGITGRSYWFNTLMAERVEAIQRYLEGLPQTGKVVSIASTLEVLTQVNGGELPDDVTLSLIYKKLPEAVKKALFTPYLSADGDQLRFEVRVYESDPTLRRQALLERIRQELPGVAELAPGDVRLTGMMVLYNNMLQSLFRSQILTLGAVFLAILLMFVVLFRSLGLAFIAIIPNLISVPVVLGLMGWLGVPLDIMTITIAAISIGIGVDDTIHYIHRYGEELARDGDYQAAVRRSHGSIGHAMYYTTVTITIGFSVLAFSQFVPTIYFGLLTALAMTIALLANLTVLPLLLERLKPYGAVPVRSGE